MMYFLHQIKHTNDAYEKGIAVKDTLDAAKQSYHAYLGAYAYDPNTDFVHCMITDENGAVLLNEAWKQEVSAEAEPEPNAE